MSSGDDTPVKPSRKPSASRRDRAGRLSGPSAATVRATAAFRTVLRRFERTSEQIARQHGLTPQRYLLLLMVKGAPDGGERSTIGELSERLQLAQHTVSELVARTERAGLIRRERSSDDRRVHHLRLTAEGERRLAAAFTDHGTERQALLAELGDAPAALKARRSR